MMAGEGLAAEVDFFSPRSCCAATAAVATDDVDDCAAAASAGCGCCCCCWACETLLCMSSMQCRRCACTSVPSAAAGNAASTLRILPSTRTCSSRIVLPASSRSAILTMADGAKNLAHTWIRRSVILSFPNQVGNTALLTSLAARLCATDGTTRQRQPQPYPFAALCHSGPRRRIRTRQRPRPQMRPSPPS